MRTVALTVVATVVLSMPLGGQSRPDMSGVWVQDPAKSGRPAQSAATPSRATVGVRGVGAPPELRITQTAGALTIERPVQGAMLKFVHTFDGQENVNVNGAATMRTKSRWDGSRLVTEGTSVVSPGSGEDIVTTVREVRSVSAGGELVVETTRTRNGEVTTGTQVFVKKQ